MWFSKSSLSAAALALVGFAASGAHAQDDLPETKSIPLRTHSLSQPYLDSDLQSRWFDFGGNTVIRTDSYVRLTHEQQSQEGWLFSRVPLTATNWQIEVEFKISGKNNLHGDGFAMWLTKQRATPGPVFGSTDNFEGLGIFFDTYKNNRPGTVFPYVMAMYGDGETSYDKNTDGKNQELAGCSARGIRNAKIPTKLRLTYFQDKQLKLELQYKKEDEWTLCFETNEPPSIPAVTYLGFSAETGELSDNHDIIDVQARNLYSPRSKEANANRGPKKGNSRADRRRRNKKNGGWLWFFVKMVLFVLVAGGAYVGWTVYRTNKKSHRF